jgi:hypothetical protein
MNKPEGIKHTVYCLDLKLKFMWGMIRFRSKVVRIRNTVLFTSYSVKIRLIYVYRNISLSYPTQNGLRFQKYRSSGYKHNKI